MRIRTAFAVAVLSLGLGAGLPPLRAQTPAPAPAATPSPVTVLKAARIFDGRSDAALPNGMVVVQGTKILAAGANLAVPAGATVIDLGDATLLPGFIDSHTHVTDQSGDNYYLDFFNGLRRPVPEQALLRRIPGCRIGSVACLISVTSKLSITPTCAKAGSAPICCRNLSRRIEKR